MIWDAKQKIRYSEKRKDVVVIPEILVITTDASFGLVSIKDVGGMI